jgi:hypothetical protein
VPHFSRSLREVGFHNSLPLWISKPLLSFRRASAASQEESAVASGRGAPFLAFFARSGIPQLPTPSDFASSGQQTRAIPYVIPTRERKRGRRNLLLSSTAVKGKGQSDFPDWPLLMPATNQSSSSPCQRTPHTWRASALQGLTRGTLCVSGLGATTTVQCRR